MMRRECARALWRVFQKVGALEGTYALTQDGVHFRAAEGVRPTWFDEKWERPEFRQVLRNAYESGVRVIQVTTNRDSMIITVDGEKFKYRW